MRNPKLQRTMKALPIAVLTLFLCATAARAQVGIVDENGLWRRSAPRARRSRATSGSRTTARRKRRSRSIRPTIPSPRTGNPFMRLRGGSPGPTRPGSPFPPRANWQIPGLATTDVRYACKIPADSNLVGTYWSIIMFEVLPPAQKGKAGRSGKDIAIGLSQVMRYGVQIVTHFGDTGKRSLKFTRTEMLDRKGRRTLQVDVENDGERWLRPFSYVEIFTEKGAAAGKVRRGDRWRLLTRIVRPVQVRRQHGSRRQL